jgi:hypothetical protein
MVLFKDLSKNGKDLLTKDFPTKMEVKIEVPQKEDLWGSASIVYQGSDFSASLNPKYYYRPYNAEISATFESQQAVKTDITVKDLFAKGLKNIFKFQVDPVNKLTIRKELEYTNTGYAVAAGVDILNPKSQNIVGSGVYSFSNTIDLGLEAEYSLLKSEVRRVHAVAQVKYDPYNAELGFFAKRTGATSEIGANIYERFSKDYTGALEVAFNPEKQGISNATVGLQAVIDPSTAAKAKLQIDGTVGVAVARRVTSNVKVILGGSVNTQTGVKGFGFTSTVNL